MSDSKDSQVQALAQNINSGIQLLRSLTLQRVVLAALFGFASIVLYTFWEFREAVAPKLLESPWALAFGLAVLLAVVLGLIGGWFIRYVDSQSHRVYTILNDRIADLKKDIEDVRLAERACQLERIQDQAKFNMLILDLSRMGVIDRNKGDAA